MRMDGNAFSDLDVAPDERTSADRYSFGDLRCRVNHSSRMNEWLEFWFRKKEAKCPRIRKIRILCPQDGNLFFDLRVFRNVNCRGEGRVHARGVTRVSKNRYWSLPCIVESAS